MQPSWGFWAGDGIFNCALRRRKEPEKCARFRTHYLRPYFLRVRWQGRWWRSSIPQWLPSPMLSTSSPTGSVQPLHCIPLHGFRNWSSIRIWLHNALLLLARRRRPSFPPSPPFVCFTLPLHSIPPTVHVKTKIKQRRGIGGWSGDSPHSSPFRPPISGNVPHSVFNLPKKVKAINSSGVYWKCMGITCSTLCHPTISPATNFISFSQPSATFIHLEHIVVPEKLDFTPTFVSSHMLASFHTSTTLSTPAELMYLLFNILFLFDGKITPSSSTQLLRLKNLVTVKKCNFLQIKCSEQLRFWDTAIALHTYCCPLLHDVDKTGAHKYIKWKSVL
jgi:hypothetical protein